MFCQLCRRNFSELDYKVHINQHHGGTEPEINYNPDMLRLFTRYQAKQKLNKESQSVKKNVICLKCSKCFGDPQYLKSHMTSFHGVPKDEELRKKWIKAVPRNN